jgi:ribosomal protein S18 acetylase RimI-like enzyme
VATRARDWYRGLKAAVCDVVEPWEHGTVLRATRYPDYYDYNVVRVEDDPGLSADALAAFADQALADSRHRRVDFEIAEAAQPLRPRFEALGWLTERLVWMRHEAEPRVGSEIAVERVPYEAVRDLRVAWHLEDFPDHDPGAYLDQARELAGRMKTEVLAVREGGVPVGFTQLERQARSAEVGQVYVHPEHRGRGLGTALTRAAIAAAGDVEDLWIVADDEGRPKELYSRLGFRPVWTAIEILRLPQ